VIQIPAQASVFVMHEPVSFRNGIDGMAGVARVVLAQEPMSGALFVFRNRRRQMLRILFYDGGGFWLCTRRLSKGTFSYWPEGDGTGPCSPLLARELRPCDPTPSPSGAHRRGQGRAKPAALAARA
jgi:transposase